MITEKNITRLRWPAIAAKVRRELADRGIETGRVEPWTEDTDYALHLAGEYDGLHIQIGDGYLSVVGRKGEDFYFVDLDTAGGLANSLTKCLELVRRHR